MEQKLQLAVVQTVTVLITHINGIQTLKKKYIHLCVQCVMAQEKYLARHTLLEMFLRGLIIKRDHTRVLHVSEQELFGDHHIDLKKSYKYV